MPDTGVGKEATKLQGGTPAAGSTAGGATTGGMPASGGTAGGANPQDTGVGKELKQQPMALVHRACCCCGSPCGCPCGCGGGPRGLRPYGLPERLPRVSPAARGALVPQLVDDGAALLKKLFAAHLKGALSERDHQLFHALQDWYTGLMAERGDLKGQ